MNAIHSILYTNRSKVCPLRLFACVIAHALRRQKIAQGRNKYIMDCASASSTGASGATCPTIYLFATLASSIFTPTT